MAFTLSLEADHLISKNEMPNLINKTTSDGLIKPESKTGNLNLFNIT